MSEIHFPFSRGRKYTFAELRAFEAALLKTRQQDAVFSGNLRSNRGPWAKTRNEELLPIGLLADHKGLADGDKFELMPEGHFTDVQLYTGGHTNRHQVTVADPAWDDSGRGSSGGYLHHLRMELLRCGEPPSAARARAKKMALSFPNLMLTTCGMTSMPAGVY